MNKSEQYLKEKFDSTVWSYSRIASFYSCPYSFYDTYILGNRRSNFHAYVGSAVHTILEDFYSYHLSGGVNLHHKVIRETLTAKFDTLMKSNPHHNEVFPKVREGVYRNVKKGLNLFEPQYDIIHVERKIEYKIEGYNFQAFLDYEKRLRVGDYKSKHDRDYSTQQNLYMYAKKEADGVVPTGYEIVAYKEGMENVFTEWDKDSVYDSLEWAVQGIKDIRQALVDDSFPKTPPINKKKPDDKFFCEALCRGCEESGSSEFNESKEFEL